VTAIFLDELPSTPYLSYPPELLGSNLGCFFLPEHPVVAAIFLDELPSTPYRCHPPDIPGSKLGCFFLPEHPVSMSAHFTWLCRTATHKYAFVHLSKWAGNTHACWSLSHITCPKKEWRKLCSEKLRVHVFWDVRIYHWVCSSPHCRGLCYLDFQV
jgi:hypothetical protein